MWDYDVEFLWREDANANIPPSLPLSLSPSRTRVSLARGHVQHTRLHVLERERGEKEKEKEK